MLSIILSLEETCSKVAVAMAVQVGWHSRKVPPCSYLLLALIYGKSMTEKKQLAKLGADADRLEMNLKQKKQRLNEVYLDFPSS